MQIAAFYFAYFLSTGILLPYLPPWLRALGFTGKELALVVSLQPILMIVVPPAWGYLADRTRRPVPLLRIASAGAALAFAPMLWARSFPSVALAIAGFALFSTAIGALADSVATAEARRLGTEFARLRLWGSLGFAAASWAFGAWLESGGEVGHVPLAALCAMAAYALASWAIPRTPGAGFAAPTLGDARAALRDPAFSIYVLGAAVHWACLAPYHLLYGVHLRDLGASGLSIGAGFALGVAAEVLAMWRYRSIAARLPAVPLLALAFGVGALRWIATALAGAGWAIAAVQLLHGVVYGVWFIASIHWIERVVPERLRATGRAIFGSIVFGLGGALGNVLAGSLYDAGGAPLAFLAAAALELVPLLLLLPLRRYAREAERPVRVR